MINILTDAGMVNSFQNDIEREYTQNDFIGLPEIAECSLSCLDILLPCLQDFGYEKKNFISLIVSVLVLCATHNKHYLWSSEACLNKANCVLKCVLNLTDCKNITELLQGTETIDNTKKFNRGIASSVFSFLKPYLTRDTWLKNPSSPYVFKWFLHLIKHPHLVDYLMDILPPSLLFVDHHLTENKVLGLECLHHIIDNVPPTELKLNGRADVVYDVLKHLMYTTETPVINALHPCLLKFLSGQERDPKRKTTYHKPGRYDEIYRQLLWNMEYEQRIQLRRAYSTYIAEYISAIGITVTCHMNRTLKVLLEYIIIYDGEEEISRINALSALKMLIAVAWPRMTYHWEEIIQNILRCIDDVETDENISIEVKSTIMKEVRECLLLMKRACPEKFTIFIQEIPTDITLPSVNFIKSLECCE